MALGAAGLRRAGLAGRPGYLASAAILTRLWANTPVPALDRGSVPATSRRVRSQP